MNEFFKKYLLSSVAAFAPPDRPDAGGGAGDPPAEGAEDAIEFQDDDPPGDSPGDDVDPDEGDGDDDDGEPEGDEGAGGRQDPAPRQSRGDRHMGELRRQARERADENARLTRELAEMRGRMDALQQSQRVPQETPQQRAERLALLTPEERAMEMVNETLNRHNANQQQLNQQLLDQSDRADYNLRSASSPLFKKLETQVERRRTEMLNREGTAPPRWVIATYLIGEKVLEQQAQRGQRGGSQRRRQQEARPVRSGGDVAPARQRRGAAPGSVEDFEARFGDVQI